MSDEMAVGDNATSEEQAGGSEDNANEAKDIVLSIDSAKDATAPEEIPALAEENTAPEGSSNIIADIKMKLSTEIPAVIKEEPILENVSEVKEELTEVKEEEKQVEVEELKAVKRRASEAFSDEGGEEFKGFDLCEQKPLPDYNHLVEDDGRVKRRKSTTTGDEFKGFEQIDPNNVTGYNQVLERLEAEVTEAVSNYTPLRTVMAMPTALVRANKRSRQDTDGSRPSSALSSRSDGEGALSTDASLSPATRRRPTTEMSSPLLRVPLERGWRRELVYRAALDAHSRRNADIYYYMPSGKKLRSMREISDHLSGTGLTIENFSFFKEPLGIDDPEKEIIRDAKMIRRVESPVPAAAPPAVDGKRTPKPKQPKGASPEPATPKSPSARLKVKSMGSRLSNNGTATPKVLRKPAGSPATPAQPPLQPLPQQQQPPQQQQQQQPPTPDNNNTSAWKKPRGAPPPLQPRPPAAPAPAPAAVHARQSQRPCSMACGRGAVPSLACAACLCLYHPACVGAAHAPPHNFFCKNCRKSSPPPQSEPPPLLHKSGALCTPSAPGAPGASVPAQAAPGTAGAPRRHPVPVPVPVPAKVPRGDKRVLLRMKKSTGASGSGGATWATVAQGPQSLAVLNGRRFIVVTRPLQN